MGLGVFVGLEVVDGFWDVCLDLVGAASFRGNFRVWACCCVRCMLPGLGGAVRCGVYLDLSNVTRSKGSFQFVDAAGLKAVESSICSSGNKHCPCSSASSASRKVLGTSGIMLCSLAACFSSSGTRLASLEKS